MKKESSYQKLMSTIHMPEEQRKQLRGELVQNMGKSKKKLQGRYFYRYAAVAAILMLSVIGCLGFVVSQPAIAAEIPILRGIFAMVEDTSLLYPGRYSEKSQEVNSKEKSQDALYYAKGNKLSIEVSEVYSDGNSVYVSMKVHSANHDFDKLALYGSDEHIESLITIKGYMYLTGEEEKHEFTTYQIEGKAVDEDTFVGMAKFDIFEDERESGELNIELYQMCYQIHMDGKSAMEYKDVWVDDTWNLKISYTADLKSLKKYDISKYSKKNCKLDHVSISEEQVVVYSGANYGIQVFDQDGKEISTVYVDPDFGAITFPMDAETRSKLSKLKIYAFAKTEDGLERNATSSFEKGTESAAKKLSDVQITIEVE